MLGGYDGTVQPRIHFVRVVILLVALPFLSKAQIRYPSRYPSEKTEAPTRGRFLYIYDFLDIFGSGGRDRTYDQLINSQSTRFIHLVHVDAVRQQKQWFSPILQQQSIGLQCAKVHVSDMVRCKALQKLEPDQ